MLTSVTRPKSAKWHNLDNERIKRWGEQSVEPMAKALARFAAYTKRRNFKSLQHSQVVGFKSHLAAQQNARTGEKLSKAA